jgi:hypothetical protein
MRTFSAFLLICMFCISCNRAVPQSSKLMQLPSGKSIRVYSIIRVSFSDNSHPPSLLLRYETALPIKDSPELRSEVLEVWELLRPLSDKSGDKYALIKANEPIRGVVSKNMSFTYGFNKVNDSTWKMREPNKE